MTIAGCSTPRAIGRCSTRSGRSTQALSQAAWAEVTRIEGELAHARAEVAAADRDRDYLGHACGEIEALSPEEGEETRLAEERTAMQAGLKAGESLTGLDELLCGSEGALALLRQAARRIERGAVDHPLLAEALASLDRAVIEASEAEDRITRAADALAYDPERLEAVEARLFDIRGLARKHRVEPDALAALGQQMRAPARRDRSRGRACRRARPRSWSRRARPIPPPPRTSASSATTPPGTSTPRWRRASSAEARRRAFPNRDRGRRAGPSGTDRVEFEVSTNPGAPFGPLTKIASGGELSRFILALKVALAEAGSAATMIFDEVDRGVGGAVASAIGERLARLAEKSQVLVVTHSPQVAARAAHHYRIEKAHGEDGTRTTVESSARASAARRSRGMLLAPPSPRKRGRRHRACSMRRDRLRRPAARREPVGRRQLRWKICGGSRPSSALSAQDLHRQRQPALCQRQNRSELKQELEAAIGDHMGATVGVMLRSASELADVASANPFSNEAANFTVAIFLDETPPAGAHKPRRTSTASGWRLGSAKSTCIIRAVRANRGWRIPAAADGHRAQYEHGRRNWPNWRRKIA